MFTISLICIESIEPTYIERDSDLDIGLYPSVDVKWHHAIAITISILILLAGVVNLRTWCDLLTCIIT
jgi:hypothetical protein